MTTTNTTLAALPSLPKMPRAPKAKTNDCACGCGQKTAARFVPGHDSRLRAWAIRIERNLIDNKGRLTADGTPSGISPGELKAAIEEAKVRQQAASKAA